MHKKPRPRQTSVAEGHRVNSLRPYIKREAQKLSDKYKMKYASKKDEEEMVRWWLKRHENDVNLAW